MTSLPFSIPMQLVLINYRRSILILYLQHIHSRLLEARDLWAKAEAYHHYLLTQQWPTSCSSLSTMVN